MWQGTAARSPAAWTAAAGEREISLPLKKPSQFKLIGSSPARLDIPAKVAGAATFGIDVRLPGLFYAAVRNTPTFGGSASGFPTAEEWAKRAVPFLLQLGPGDNGKPLTAP